MRKLFENRRIKFLLIQAFHFYLKERDGTLADVEVANEDSNTNLYNLQSEINVISTIRYHFKL